MSKETRTTGTSYRVHWNDVCGYGQGPHWEKEPPEKEPPENSDSDSEPYAEIHEHGTNPKKFSDLASANKAARAKFDVRAAESSFLEGGRGGGWGVGDELQTIRLY